MPELPEVETTRRGIAPHITGQKITGMAVRQPSLRWPIPATLPQILTGLTVTGVSRRGKYLLLTAGTADNPGTCHVLLHLGMSGSLRMVPLDEPAKKHDHADIIFENQLVLRYSDPRRFGCILLCDGEPASHPLLCNLGPEPLTPSFTDDHLHRFSRGRSAPVKSFIMDSHVVVGVGNIYANEALFLAGIHPARAAGKVSAARYAQLTAHIREILNNAIAMGGTTLRDFVGGDGKPGYFKQSLHVYGREGQPCTRCGTPLKEIRITQRSTVFCARCQR